MCEREGKGRREKRVCERKGRREERGKQGDRRDRGRALQHIQITA